MQYSVYSISGRCLDWHASEGEKQRLIRKNQARILPGGRAIRLTGVGESWASATHVSSAGPFAAAGLSQKYTRDDGHRHVVGFRRIERKDVGYFVAAVRNDFDL